MKNLLKSIVLSFRIDGSIWGLIYLLLLHPLGGWGQANRSVAKPTAPASTERRLALVVGNKDYGRPDARLQNPLNDANDMAATLRNLGFEVITRSNLDRSRLETAIDDFASRLQGYDVGLFYFSGHGMAVQGENYLLPAAHRCQPHLRNPSPLTVRIAQAGARWHGRCQCQSRLGVA